MRNMESHALGRTPACFSSIQVYSEWMGSKNEISNHWAIRQSCTSEMQDVDILLRPPTSQPVSWSLIPRKDKDSRRVCEERTFRDEFLSGVQGEELPRDIFSVVSIDSEEVQDPILPSYQEHPSSSALLLNMGSQSFEARPFGLTLANGLAKKPQRAIDVPNASTSFVPSTPSRRELSRLLLSPPTLKEPEAFQDYTCEALPEDLMFPDFSTAFPIRGTSTCSSIITAHTRKAGNFRR
jgi:hypothetical protein